MDNRSEAVKETLISDKQVFSLKPVRRDGLILQLHNTIPSSSGEVCRVRFSYIAFDYSGEILAAVDHRGGIFIIDLVNTKFWLLPTLGGCSFIAFSPFKQYELLVGTVHCTLSFIHTETGIVSASLEGHTAPVRQASFSCQGEYCLTVSSEEAIIWDLQTCTQAHHLVMSATSIPKQVVFMPVLNHILACFQDDSITVWMFKTFECVKKFSPDSWKCHHLCTVAFTRNGRTMIIGGHTKFLPVILIDNWTTEKVIELPESMGGVKHIEFLPQGFDGGANKILGILTSGCVLHFMDIETQDFLKTNLAVDCTMTKFCCSGNGKYVAGILHSGEVNVYQSSRLVVMDDRSKPIITRPIQKSVKKPDTKLPLQHKTKPVLHQKLEELSEQVQDELDKERLLPILKEFGEYPEEHRVVIWNSLLCLPHNRRAFVSLVNRDCHPAYASLQDVFPIHDMTVLKNLKRVLSCLAHWCPLFAEVTYLPGFLFPFIKILKNDPLVSFEAILTIIMNWCQKWFEYFPFPPLNILGMIEHVLDEHDPELFKWFSEQGITSKTYAWLLLETAFSKVLTGPEWLVLWDNILSNEPSFFIMAVVSYNIICRSALKSCKSEEDFLVFYHNKNPIDIKKLISRTYRLLQKTSDAVHPRQYLKPFKSLEKDMYPVFNKYPKHLINYKMKHGEKLRQEEKEIKQEMESHLLKRKTQIEKKRNEAKKEVEEERLLSLEKEFRERLLEEEDAVAAQRRKLLSVRKELHEKELELLKDAKERIMQQNYKRRQAELQHLMYEIDRKRGCQDLIIETVEAEAQQQYAKLECQKAQLELELNAIHIDAPLSMEHTTLQLQQEQLVQDLYKMREENSSSCNAQQLDVIKRIAVVDDMLYRVEMELAKEMALRQHNLESNHANMKTLELAKKTKNLELEVQYLLEQLTALREHESKMRMNEVLQSQQNRWEINEASQKIVKEYRNAIRALDVKDVSKEGTVTDMLANASIKNQSDLQRGHISYSQHGQRTLPEGTENHTGSGNTLSNVNVNNSSVSQKLQHNQQMRHGEKLIQDYKNPFIMSTCSGMCNSELGSITNVDDDANKKREELLRRARCHVWARKSKTNLRS